MRHQKKTTRLGLKDGHRKSLLSNLACSLIEHNRIKTTLAKAKALRPLAEKMVTIGKKGTIHARRTAKAVLRQDNIVKILFADVAPRAAARQGGYTRIIKLGRRQSDSAEMALIEWVDSPVAVETAAEPAPAKKPAAKKPAATKNPAKAKADAEPATEASEEKPASKPRAKKKADGE